jgi:hypothetical protein
MVTLSARRVGVRPAVEGTQGRTPSTSSHLARPPWARRNCACCAGPKPQPLTLASSPPPPPPPPSTAPPSLRRAVLRRPPGNGSARRDRQWPLMMDKSQIPPPPAAAPPGGALITYLYDGECPLRKPEVDVLRRLDGGRGRIHFVDIADDYYNPSAYQDITYEDAMGPPAAILDDGTVVRRSVLGSDDSDRPAREQLISRHASGAAVCSRKVAVRR